MTRDIHLNIASYLAPLLVVGLVSLRLVRNKPRKVKPNRLFVLPALLALAAAVPLSQTPSPAWVWFAVDIVAVAAGGASDISADDTASSRWMPKPVRS
jgi:hypothetical protein